MTNKNLAIFTSWNVAKNQNKYYISSTHFSYLQFASAYFEKVLLITSIKCKDEVSDLECLSELRNIEIMELPTVTSYVGSYKHFFQYRRVLRSIPKQYNIIYCRVPDPFCWYPALFLKDKQCIMHYVGDTIDATKHNEQWSSLKKKVMTIGYLPDYLLTLFASKRAKVYTNGIHLRDKLAKKRIIATAVISSTISESEIFPMATFRTVVPPVMIYVGFLRFAKGMNLLMKLWIQLKQKWPDFKFNIVGNGEMQEKIELFVKQHHLERNVILHGFIANRQQINKLLRTSDLFVFPSLSEGSPRVVIEAMSQGIPVASTPVGSLPHTFTDGDTIRYFDYDNLNQIMSIIEEYCKCPKRFDNIRIRAYEMVKNKFTKEKFLSQIYSYE